MDFGFTWQMGDLSSWERGDQFAFEQLSSQLGFYYSTENYPIEKVS